jgi:hypothetical protein
MMQAGMLVALGHGERDRPASSPQNFALIKPALARGGASIASSYD